LGSKMESRRLTAIHARNCPQIASSLLASTSKERWRPHDRNPCAVIR
jgi:hypothetical protein